VPIRPFVCGDAAFAASESRGASAAARSCECQARISDGASACSPYQTYSYDTIPTFPGLGPCDLRGQTSAGRFTPPQIDPPSEATILCFKILHGRLNLDYRLRLLTAIYEAFTERVFGRTHAFKFVSHQEYLEHNEAAACAVWQPTFLSPPPLLSFPCFLFSLRFLGCVGI
jgi:hypothetical protein